MGYSQRSYIYANIFNSRDSDRVARDEPFCWAQSVDMRDPWISLRNLWIASSRRNPWISAQTMDDNGSIDCAGRSMDCADPQIAPNSTTSEPSGGRSRKMVAIVAGCRSFRTFRDCHTSIAFTTVGPQPNLAHIFEKIWD